MDWSPGYLLSSLLISCAGMGFFLYGKKAQRLFPLLAGIALGVYPFFVSNLWMMWGLAVVIIAFVWFLREQ